MGLAIKWALATLHSSHSCTSEHSISPVAISPRLLINSQMASAFALPLADQISTWTELNPHGGHDTSSDQPFHQRIQDKSTFYRFSAAEWDRSSEKSYQLWDDYDIIHEHAAAIAKLIRPGDTILEYGPGLVESYAVNGYLPIIIVQAD